MKFCLVILGCVALLNLVNSQSSQENAVFQCPSGRLIPVSLVCNAGHADGYWGPAPPPGNEHNWHSGEYASVEPDGDWSHAPPESGESSSKENNDDDAFVCNNGNRIPKWYTCDEYDDCGDMSDEPEDKSQCPACEEDKFWCTNGKCITGSYACDGFPDCSDRSDEDNCTNDDTHSTSDHVRSL